MPYRPFQWTVVILALSIVSGCASFSEKMPHELKPHRLWRLNRQPDTKRDVYSQHLQLHDDVIALRNLG